MEWPRQRPGPVLTIGNFDGVHKGHAALVGRTVALARELSAPAAAYTFDPAPRDVLRPDNGIPRIQSLDDRVRMLGALGIDAVVVERFTREFGSHGADWFAEEVLTRRLRVRAVVVGWDFRFGRGREGTFEGLRERLAVPVERVEALTDGSEVVSSSRIREALASGDVQRASSLLGRPHEVRGEVVHGDGRGTGLGVPTANVEVHAGLLPGAGVFAVRMQVGDRWLRGVANLGQRPTFAGAGLRLEVHVLDEGADWYGHTVRVAFVARIRSEQRFSDTEALIRQIGLDVARARELLA